MKHHTILSEQQAIEIFRIRSAHSIVMMVSSALFIAKRYGVSERTVRDIWKQRTWVHATRPLTESIGPMAKKKLGRPIGSKDLQPRKQKLVVETSISPMQFAALNSDALQPSSTLKQMSESQTGPVADPDYIPHDGVECWLPMDLLLSEPADEPAAVGDEQSLPVCERREQLSIDDQLHAWAQCESPWIINAALPLGT
jgi:hypothetical protein